ncbi:MAG: peptidase S1 [Brevundimonas subvibrioides]|uniref:Peptidase S1 n=1 Tax=Brevundimonas subvibrioides TaxID=74313 RepID=A0A258HKC6_9CAUL|nr:peptidase S1 [Brevundimonas subvibrioides]OYX57431.1 MAG: peptidase S1 [Brevundimonas subvibrioides]
MRTVRLASAIAAALMAAAAATTAAAQDPSAAATSGSMRARAGFTPDPIQVSIYSGGSIDASRLGGACVGMIASAPDYEFTYTAGSFPLSFGVVSNGDTSLVINGPDGRWYCNDDAEGLNPVLTWGRPPSGSYDIWVGAVGEASSSTLLITESN